MRCRDLARRIGWTFTVHHTDQPPHRLLMALHALIADDRHRFGAQGGRGMTGAFGP